MTPRALVLSGLFAGGAIAALLDVTLHLILGCHPV